MRKVSITCGDPAGLGPELVSRCLQSHRFEAVGFRVFGPTSWLEELGRSSANDVEILPLGEFEGEVGKPTGQGSRIAVEALEAAARDCVEGRSDAVVTGPISKSLCAEQGFSFPGQTEFFAARWGGEPTMAFVGSRLRLCLATWHVPLNEVARCLDEACFKRAVRAAATLGRLSGVFHPRILVCGLNPHAGENGLLGEEELTKLNPWLDELRGELDIPIEGCIPGDTAFFRALKETGDVVVAMYHDQGLAPFKALEFDSGVNVTLGLSHLRVSPDHGTGFDIAGKGLASAESMMNAIRLACRGFGALEREA